MVDTVGIRFPNSGKTSCFSAEAMELSTGERVVVESELGISIGTIAKTPFAPEGPEDKLRPVLRKVTAADLKQEEENEGVRQEANAFCKERILGRELPMKLITTEVTLDRRRFIFYFTADSRIDFRELVKDLASKFRTRIELRQIGVRDAAKMAGGYGICGKEVCCKTWLRTFAPISIKMAKQQDLVLNTCKLSGLCGRLLCCLNYEYEEGAPRRKRQKARVEAPKEAPQVIPEMPETVEAADEATAVSGVSGVSGISGVTGTAGTKPEAQAQPAQGAESEKSSERRHFKKGRRSRRSRAKRKVQTTTGTGESTDKAPTEARQARPQQGPDRQGEVRQKGEASADSPSKSKRRRRRRGKRRKPGNAPGGGDGSNKPDNPSGSSGPTGSDKTQE